MDKRERLEMEVRLAQYEVAHWSPIAEQRKAAYQEAERERQVVERRLQEAKVSLGLYVQAGDQALTDPVTVGALATVLEREAKNGPKKSCLTGKKELV